VLARAASVISIGPARAREDGCAFAAVAIQGVFMNNNLNHQEHSGSKADILKLFDAPDMHNPELSAGVIKHIVGLVHALPAEPLWITMRLDWDGEPNMDAPLTLNSLKIDLKLSGAPGG